MEERKISNQKLSKDDGASGSVREISDTRYNHYKVPEVESFMVRILERKDKIEPVFDLKLGYRYPEVEEIVGMDSSQTIAFLDKLFEMGILDREVYDMELVCPTCKSTDVSTNYICPHCGSSSIQKTILLEHHKCGYLGTATSYGELLVCPHCEERVEEGEYRDAGSIFECLICQRQIETPFVNHWCRVCNLKFSFENAGYHPKYAYFPNALTRKEVSAGIPYLYQIVNIFEGKGFERKMNPKVIDKVGVEQVFDLAFEGFGQNVYVDVVFDLNLMTEMDLLRQYGKIKNVQGSVYVIVLPGMDDAAAKLANSYEMTVIDANKPSDALSKLSTDLEAKGFASKGFSPKPVAVREQVTVKEQNDKEPSDSRGLFRRLRKK